MISIIVPVYNIEKYLPRCLDSLIGQSFLDIEIIIVDDGSTDGCYYICEEYGRKDPRIVVIHKTNGGLVSARKVGMKAARGEYIAYVDGDDWIEPQMYEQMYQKMIEENVDIVMCGRFEDMADTSKKVFHGVKEGRYKKQELQKLVYPKMISGDTFFEWGIFPGLWDKLFRRDCIEMFQLAVDDRIAMGEDAACTYPCLLNTNSIYVIHECLYHYRQNESSMVRKSTEPEKERKKFCILYQSVYNVLEKNKYIYDLREQWKKYVLFLMVPRADTLLEGIECLDYLFPFPEVRKGSNIIIYGMGVYGQRLYQYIKRTGFCNLVAAVDQNYAVLNKKEMLIEAPENIVHYNYDAIVIAISFAKARTAVYRELCRLYFPDKIHNMSEELIFSDEIQKRFGII